MMRAVLSATAGVAVIAAVLLAGLVNTGESRVAPPRSLGPDELLSAYEASLDPRWAPIAAQYPGASRPSPALPEEYDGEAWGAVIAGCLERVGYDVVEFDGGGFEASTRAGTDLEQLAVGEYECYARHVFVGTLDGLFSTEERESLYTYYVSFLTPCLRMLGEDVAAVPPRNRFIGMSQSEVYWHPFFSAGRPFTDEERLRIDARCPLEPEWRR